MLSSIGKFHCTNIFSLKESNQMHMLWIIHALVTTSCAFIVGNLPWFFYIYFSQNLLDGFCLPLPKQDQMPWKWRTAASLSKSVNRFLKTLLTKDSKKKFFKIYKKLMGIEGKYLLQKM